MKRGQGMEIPMPVGQDQCVHPDVVHAPVPFLGFPFWMACTPYAFGDDRLENPVVRVSHDGLRWRPFPGAPDPLVPAPADPEVHHADTDLVLWRDALYLFYITTHRSTGFTAFSLLTSRDGVRWDGPQVLFQGPWGVSPAVIAGGEDGRPWRMWYIWRDAAAHAQVSQLLLREAAEPGAWGEPLACGLEVPGHVPWHLDVIQVEEGYEAVIAAFPLGTDQGRCRLFHATSQDGRTFRLSSPRPILAPSRLGWDNRAIYRSTFLKLPGGDYRLWYSAMSWGKRWGIGCLEGRLEDMHARRGAAPAQAPSLARKLTEDLEGYLRYQARRLIDRPRAHKAYP